MTKISDLTALTGAGVDMAADLLPIVDMSLSGTARNKKILGSELKIAFGLSGTNSGDQTITLTGDVTGSGAGSFAATIANNAVSFAKFVAAPSAGVVWGSGAANYAHNASGGGTTNFLRADGTWAAPPGSGGFTAASTTEVLTGTDTSKGVTPDALAALWEQGSDVASAGTTSLGEGGYFNITGTTTITDIDFATDKAGRHAWVKFAGILTLTHNASTLILPTGANITTAAGDTACFVSEDSDAVRCVAYNRASGAALAAGSSGTWTQILASTSITNPSAQYDISGLSGYSEILIIARNMTASSAGFRVVQAGKSGTFYSTSGDYKGISTTTGAESNAADWGGNGSSTSSAATIVTRILNNKTGAVPVSFQAASVPILFVAVAAPIDSARIKNTAGNLTGGTVEVWGRA